VRTSEISYYSYNSSISDVRSASNPYKCYIKPLAKFISIKEFNACYFALNMEMSARSRLQVIKFLKSVSFILI
jgi:hypothetical protein